MVGGWPCHWDGSAVWLKKFSKRGSSGEEAADPLSTIHGKFVWGFGKIRWAPCWASAPQPQSQTRERRNWGATRARWGRWDRPKRNKDLKTVLSELEKFFCGWNIGGHQPFSAWTNKVQWLSSCTMCRQRWWKKNNNNNKQLPSGCLSYHSTSPPSPSSLLVLTSDPLLTPTRFPLNCFDVSRTVLYEAWPYRWWGGSHQQMSRLWSSPSSPCSFIF